MFYIEENNLVLKQMFFQFQHNQIEIDFKSKKDKDSIPKKIKVAPKKNPKADADNSDKNKTATISKTKLKELERPFSMTGGDGLKSPSVIFEERWRKEAQATGIRRFMSDQFLGQYDIDTEFVNICNYVQNSFICY